MGDFLLYEKTKTVNLNQPTAQKSCQDEWTESFDPAPVLQKVKKKFVKQKLKYIPK